MSSKRSETTEGVGADGETDTEPGTVQLLVADEGNRTTIRKMLSEYFDVETSQTVQDADLYLVEDHLFAEHREAIRERVERAHPTFCPVVLIRRETTELAHPTGDGSFHGGPMLLDDVVDAPIDRSLLLRRLHSLLVRRRQSQELSSHVSTLEERERKLRRFERAVEENGTATVITDSDGVIEYANSEFEEMAGYAEADVLGRSLETFLADESLGAVNGSFWQTMAETGEWEGELLLERKNDQRRITDTTISPIRDDGGENEGFVVVMPDITQRIEREQLLQDREGELDLLRQILSRYLRHNLRNKLNVILGYAEMLEAKLPEEDAEDAAKIVETTNHLMDTSEKARKYSTLTEQETDLARHNVSEIVEGIVSESRERYPDVSFEANIAEDCQLLARDGIREAIDNLIDNAARHNDADDPWVRVTVTDHGGAQVVIEDNGPGICELELSTLEQGSETPLRHSQGIGLWLSKWVIEGIDGRLSFDTTDGGGTRVTVDFSQADQEGATGVAVSDLKAREQRLRTITQRMTDAVIEVDASWEITFVDAQAEEILAVDADAIQGQDFWEVFSDLRETELEETYRGVMRSRSAATIGEFYGAIDGWLDIYVYPDFDGGLSFYFRNITEHKERERELTRIKRAIDEAPVGVTITDPARDDNPIIYANDHFEELTGYAEDEILGRNCRFLQGKATDAEPVAKIRRGIDRQERVSAELRNYRKDGTEFWNEISIAPVRDDDGSLVNYVGFQRNVSDQRRRESVLREMYGIISDRDQSFEGQVRALLDLGRAELDTEYGTLSEIRGDEYVFEVVSSDDDSIRSGDVVPVSATNCERVASTEKTLVLGDIERDAPEQTDRAGYTEWGISCYLGAPVYVDDEVYGTFCFYGAESRSDQFSEWEVTLVDLMSRWASYELQRRQTNERLQQTNDQLEEFSSVVSHDLRNPLNVAEGRLDLLRDECESGHIEPLGRALDRMDELITDLLTLARGGDGEGERTPVPLVTLAETGWRNVDTAGATLSTDVDRTVRVDESRLRQLFENLIRNAVEHGGDDVTVTVGELDGGFYVEDDGRGIPADERADVFEPGYSTQTAGTGFGLPIVEQIAETHGWEVRVTEGTGGGARFEITGVE